MNEYLSSQQFNALVIVKYNEDMEIIIFKYVIKKAIGVGVFSRNS